MLLLAGSYAPACTLIGYMVSLILFTKVGLVTDKLAINIEKRTEYALAHKHSAIGTVIV